MKIGLFGGSFNPIHNGHLVLGTTMREVLALDEVWYMVSPQNPLKAENGNLADEQVRLRMVERAVADYEGLRASDYEFRLPRPSYTWNTLQCLAKDYPGCEFVLIIGGDNWRCFDLWAHHEDIVRDYRIAVFPRSGSDIDVAALPESVCVVDVPRVDVTSTMLREMVSRGENIAGFVPGCVVEEVEKCCLYR